MTAPLRVLITSPYLPWPTTTGGRTRQHALIRQLAAMGHRISLLALVKEPPRQDDLTYLRGFVEAVDVVQRRSRTSPVTLMHAALSLRRPAVATVNGLNEAYSRLFTSRLREGKWDVVHVEHSYAFEPLDAPLRHSGHPFILSEQNVESRVLAEQYARLPRPLRHLARLDAMRARAWEREVIQRAAHVVAVSAEDAAHLQAMGARATTVVPNGIDTRRFADVTNDIAAQCLLYLGNYDYAPNHEAVRWLCDEIMPAMWRQRPHVRLAVCGHGMPPEWRARWPDDRLIFRGYVEDLPLVHASSSVFVAALRTGGGSKLKVLEAMASGMPVVGTSEAVSGLAVQPDREYIHAETTEQFVMAVTAVLDDERTAREVGRRARMYAAAHHDWVGVAQRLEQVYRSVAR